MEDYGKVSIIIPVYNCKRYLPRCVQSAIGQTYENIEIIIVDDGSTDGTSEMCDEFARQFTSIRVFHQANSGPGTARNAALEAATGEYVTYIDSDDYVAEEYVETMLGLLKKYHADIAEVGLICLQQIWNVFEASDGAIKCFEGTDVLIKDYFSENKEIRNCVGGRMYDMKKFKDIRFSKRTIGEDSEYSLRMLFNCDRLVKYHKCLYVCRAYQESLTRSKLNHKNFDIVEVVLRDAMLADRQGMGAIDWEYISQNFIHICYELLQKIASDKKEMSFAMELERMTAAFEEMQQLAKSHGIELPVELPEDIRNIDLWARKYRKKNWFELFVVRRIKSWITRIVVFYKVKTLYEYKFEH